MKILIVDDEENSRIGLEDLLNRRGFEVKTFPGGEPALKELEQNAYCALITDLRMPGMDGIELARRATEIRPGLFVILLTAYGTIENAVEALKDGIHDYMIKPVRTEELFAKLKRIEELCGLREEVEDFRRRFGGTVQLQDLVSQDPKMLEVFRSIEQAAATTGTVLITGETGTGKELVARAIHGMGSRSGKPFIEVHCAAYSEGLIESELFGHAKGAFTGALQERKGKIRTADGGTLFLDEISSISMNVQTKLLRVLQDRKVEPVGSDQAVPVDIRVIAASNEALEPLIKEGKFRADLFYRLNVLHIHLPPLRHRRGDIPLLVNHFINKKAGDRPIRVSSDLMGVLIRHPWYGNVRELENCVEAMVAKCDGPIFLPKHLPFIPAGPWESRLHFGASLDQLMSAFEKFLLIDALKAARGRIGTTGKMLGITERTLERKLYKYELQKESFKSAEIGSQPESSPKEMEEVGSPFKMLVQYHPDPFIWVDRNLKVLAMSPPTKSLSRCDDKVVIGTKHCFDFLNCRPDGSGGVQCGPQRPYCLDTVKEQKTSSGASILLESADGNEKWVQASIIPLPQSMTGMPNTSVIVLRDITALKQTEQELRKQLERVQEANEALRRAKEEGKNRTA